MMGLYCCPMCCQQKFNSVLALQEHLLYFTYRPLTCMLCSFSVGGIYGLTRHLESHLNEKVSDQPKLIAEEERAKVCQNTDEGSLSINNNDGIIVSQIILAKDAKTLQCFDHLEMVGKKKVSLISPVKDSKNLLCSNHHTNVLPNSQFNNELVDFDKPTVNTNAQIKLLNETERSWDSSRFEDLSITRQPNLNYNIPGNSNLEVQNNAIILSPPNFLKKKCDESLTKGDKKLILDLNVTRNCDDSNNYNLSCEHSNKIAKILNLSDDSYGDPEHQLELKLNNNGNKLDQFTAHQIPLEVVAEINLERNTKNSTENADNFHNLQKLDRKSGGKLNESDSQCETDLSYFTSKGKNAFDAYCGGPDSSKETGEVGYNTVKKTISSPSYCEIGEAVRAFVCTVCGAKFVGKDAYFKHLQDKFKSSGCMETTKENIHELKDSPKLATKTIFENPKTEGQPNVKSLGQKFMGSVSDPILGNFYKKPSTTFKSKDINNLLHCKVFDSSDINNHNNFAKSKNLATDLPKENLSNAAIKQGITKVKGCENTVHELQATLNSVGRPTKQKISQPFPLNCPINSDFKLPIETCKFEKNLHSKPYIHKKFNHDQERKVPSVTSTDMQCYIQNFQSLLVNRLNQALETENSKKPKLQEADLEESVPEITNSNTEVNSLNSKANSSLLGSVNDLVDGRYKCNYCSKTFQLKQSRNNHERKHTGHNTHKCKYCHKIFIKPHLLYRHQKELHSSKTFFCSRCGQHFSSWRTLENHKGIHESQKFQCTKCAYKCHTASGLRTHNYETHNEKKPKDITCSICGENFKKKYGLQRHMKRKHESEILSCKYCEKEFSCQEDLTHHLVIHLDNESLTCNCCNKMFTSLWSLKRHKMTHHLENKLFQCTTCSSVFKRKDYLRSHMKLHNSNRKLKCKYGSGLLTKSLSDVQKNKSKTNSQQYKCNFCGRTYKFKASLKNHSCKLEPA